uniref:Transmembrane protein 186 n=1 Tax=Rhabditophanes sp. KR3021 TaxID=114890 RepID=A0AC35TQN0_9BILA
MSIRLLERHVGRRIGTGTIITARTLSSEKLQSGKKVQTESPVTAIEDSWKERIKSYVTDDPSDRFTLKQMLKVHTYDQKDPKEWILIYRDVSATRISGAFSIICPIIVSVVAIMIYDGMVHEGKKERLSATQRLISDSEELGVLVIVPCLLVGGVATVLLRVNYLRPLRIYQCYKNPGEYVVVTPRVGSFHRQIEFKRSEGEKTLTREFISSDDTQRAGLNNLWSELLHGNASFAGRKFLMDPDCWRSAKLKNFMFNF